MSTVAAKITDFFSDFKLELELFFDRFSKSKTDEPAAMPIKVEQSSAEATDDSATDAPAKEEVKVEAKAETKAPMGQIVKAEKKKDIKIPFAIKMLRLSKKEKLFFFDQMATLVDSGVTLIDSLSVVKAQSNKKGLQRLYAEMIHHINTGMSLAESMYLYPHLFPSMQAALIEAGEASGNLKAVLIEIVSEMDDQQDFYRKVTGAMFYPMILVILSVTMVAGMMMFVIPKVAKMYEQSKVALPTITQKVIDVSNYISASWQFLLIYIAGGLFFLWFFTKKTSIGKLLWEKFVSIIPMFGKIAQEKNIMLIASNMAMLLQSGVLISDAFEITEKTVDSLHYKKELSKIRHGIVNGRNISEMMGLEDLRGGKIKKNKLFPLQVAQLMHIGETTGTIAKMFCKIRDNYHKSIDYKLKNISTVVEPMMIFFVALLVGTILMAVMLPFFYMGDTIG